MTENTKNKISKLVAFRYKLIEPTHHKDRDCHYKIGVRFSYAGTAKYFVDHPGYQARLQESYASMEDAEEALVKFLVREIVFELAIVDVPEDDPEWGWADMPLGWYVARAKEWEGLREELGL